MIIGTYKDSAMPIGRQSDVHDEVAQGSSSGGDKKLAGWAYVGSHNFTPSAWGTLSGTADKPSLNVRVRLFFFRRLFPFSFC